MKTLSSTLARLTTARVLAEVPLVIIRPVSDHSVPDLEAREIAATHPIVRHPDSPASETSMLQSVAFPVETMSHIPSPVPGAVDSLTRRIRFALINSPFQTFLSFFDYLTRDAPLDRAEVQLRTIVVPPRELGNDPLHRNRLDIGASAGELVDVFSGRIERVVSVGDVITCEGRSSLPVVPWKLVPDDGSDPRDRGLRLPLPLGQPVAIRCVNLVVGGVSTLLLRLRIGDTTAVIADVSDFPDDGSAKFAGETILWSGKTDNVLTGLTRGALGSTEADHIVGTQIFQIAPITLGVASQEISSVRGLFIRNNLTNTTVEISSLLYSVDYTDEATLPGTSGDPITSVSMTSIEVASLLSGLFAEAAVTQQAVYSTEEEALITVTSDDTDDTDNLTFDQQTGATGFWANVTSAPVWTLNKSGILQEGLRAIYPTGLSEKALQGLRTARFDFEINVTTLDTPIALGLIATGAEGALSGFVDGNVVASVEVVTTGTKIITGNIFPALDGVNVGDLDDVILNFVKGEITSQGNPAIVFEVVRITTVYQWLDDLEEVSNFFPMDDFTDDANGNFGGTWEGAWNNLGTSTPDQVETGTGTEHRLIAKMLSDPLDDTPITDLEFEFETRGVNNAPANTFSSHFGFESSTWTGKITGVPSDFSHTHAAATTTTINSVKGMTPVAGLTSLDLVGIQVDVENEGVTGGGPNTLECKIIGLNLTYDIKKTISVPIQQTADAQIQTASGGIGLEFFAIVDGPLAPDNTYSAPLNTLMTHPSDMIRYWLQEIGGIPSADVDTISFDEAVTNLPGYEFGFDARNLGQTWEAILLRMGYEARANIARPSGGDWKLFTAGTSHTFGSAVATIDSTDRMSEIHKDDAETKSRLTVFFGHDPRFDGFDSRGFLGVQTTTPAEAAAVEVEFGRNDAEPYFLLCHNGFNAAGITDWRGYMEQELGRGARIFAGRVDHWQAWPLELGDVVDLVTTTGTTKCRVLEVNRNSTQGFLIRFVEVL